jgi:hypothetical protein
LEILAGSAALAGLREDWYLANRCAKTELEAADGRWQEALLGVGHDHLMSLEELAAAFTQQVVPAMSAVGTRVKHWLYWRAVVTWALAHKCMARLLPMTEQTLMALSWDLINLHCAAGQVSDVWSAVQARHLELRLVPPLTGKGTFSRFRKGVASLTGQPYRLSYPVLKENIHALLLLDVDSPVQLRNLLLTAVSTVCAIRPAETRKLRACDMQYDYDRGRGLDKYDGSAALRVPQRKQDQVRKGHNPRIGRSKDPRKDIVYQMRRYMGANGLRVSNACHQKGNPGAACANCPPMFPRSKQEWRKGTDGVARQRTVLTDQPMSPAGVTAAIRQAMEMVGADGSRFTAKACRKGGISVAMEAGVPESVLWMQSGHSQTKAARVYVELSSPALLFDSYLAFGL